MGYTHHDGIAVYGSGIAVGKKPQETRIVDKSGQIMPYNVLDHAGNETVIDTSGFVQPYRTLKAANDTYGHAFEFGTVGFSGWKKFAYSTALSTIVWAQAQAKIQPLAAQTELTGASGKPGVVYTQWSGHALDFTVHAYNGSGCLTSAGVSTIIAWMAWGR